MNKDLDYNNSSKMSANRITSHSGSKPSR